MHARLRPLAMAAAAAAVTAASLPLWASTASAGEDPDEQLQGTRTVNVNGVNCQIQLYSQRYVSDVFATTAVVTTADQCRTDQVNASVTFRTQQGDTVSATSGDVGPSAVVAASPAVDLVRSTHMVTFANGTHVSYTLNSK
jgi:hypothetical protein